MKIRDLLLAVATPDVRVHRTALDWAWPDERYLDHKVIKPARFEARQGRHLGTRLNLEYPDRVGAAQHCVHVVVLRDGRDVDLVAPVFTDQVDGVVQRREHAEAEQIELHEARSCTVVFVPLQHRPLVHPAPLDRAYLDHRPVGDHHAARVDTEVARRVFDFERQFKHRLRNDRSLFLFLLLHCHRNSSPAIDLFRPGVLLAGFVAERFGHVAHRRTRPVGDHVGDLCGVMSSVAFIHVLDDFLAAVRLDVDVNVGWAIPLGRQEAFEQQAERHGIGGRDPDGVADRRVRCTPAPLTVNVGTTAEFHEIPHHKEVAGEVELFDQRQLTVNGLPSPGSQRQIFRLGWPGPVALRATCFCDLAEVLHLGERLITSASTSGAWERWEFRRHECEVECRCLAHSGCPLNRARISSEASLLLGTRSQMCSRRARQPRVDIGQAAP